MKFEIFTENLNKSTIIALTSQLFENATFTDTLGMYQGVPEEGLVITIVGVESDRARIQSLAVDIKELNQQDSVLIVETPVTYNLI